MKIPRKGVSTAIAGMLVFALLVLVFVPFMTYVLTSMMNVGKSINRMAIMERLREQEIIDAEYSKLTNTLVMNNTGSISIGIKYLIVIHNGSRKVIDLYQAHTNGANIHVELMKAHCISFSNDGYIEMPPNSAIKIRFPKDMEPIAIITIRGKIINLKEVYKIAEFAEVAESTKVVSVSFVGVESIDKLINRGDIIVTHDPKIPENDASQVLSSAYIQRGGGALEKVLSLKNVEVEIKTMFKNGDGGFAAGNVIIGYSPKSSVEPKRYSIMISGVDFDMLVDNPDESIIKFGDYQCTADGWTWDCNFDALRYLVLNDYVYRSGGFRIIIKDFEGSICIEYNNTEYINNTALGVYFYGGIAVPMVLKLSGYAANVTVYIASESNNIGGAQPYFFFTDTDGNGLPEMFFVTEDFEYGHVDSIGDYRCNNYGCYDLLDKSLYPLWIIFSSNEYVVDSSKYAQVLFTIRLYFHDNAGGDTDDVDDPKKGLFGIYLIDPETGEIVSSREFIYQELDDIEDTWPPNTNFVTFTIPLIVPNTGKKYYIAMAFQDPYYYRSYQGYDIDDVDFTLGIEWVGLSYFYRG